MTKIPSVNTLVPAIQHGALVVYPTDTLYALGASVFHQGAIAKVFSLKLRPLDMPLPIAVSSLEQLDGLVAISSIGLLLANHFLPGPLTLIVKNQSIPSMVTGGKETIAIRMPNDPVALELLERVGPLTVTSANIHGYPTPSTVDEIRNMFKSEYIALYIDDGVREGNPSTIIDVTSERPMILRSGKITEKQIEEVVADKNA